MKRFNTKLGATFIVGAAAFCMVLSPAVGCLAVPEQSAELAASETSLGVWKACALLVRERGNVLVVDIRPKQHFDAYHLPGAINLGASEAKTAAAVADSKDHILLVADQEKDALLLATELVRSGKRQVHVLKDGAQSWYLAFELPVPLFSDKPPPDCSCEAMAVVQAWLRNQDSQAPGEVLTALAQLSKTGYHSTLLGLRKPAAPPSSAQKKILEQFRWMDL